MRSCRVTMKARRTVVPRVLSPCKVRVPALRADEKGPKAPIRGHDPARGERGATILEYVLLVALVAMASAGALVYLGRGSASPGRAANNAAIGVSGGDGGSSGATPTTTWCASSASGCTLEAGVGDPKTINFWATGGIPPYNYSLRVHRYLDRA
jgi:hypothetical protein